MTWQNSGGGPNGYAKVVAGGETIVKYEGLAGFHYLDGNAEGAGWLGTYVYDGQLGDREALSLHFRNISLVEIVAGGAD